MKVLFGATSSSSPWSRLQELWRQACCAYWLSWASTKSLLSLLSFLFLPRGGLSYGQVFNQPPSLAHLPAIHAALFPSASLSICLCRYFLYLHAPALGIKEHLPGLEVSREESRKIKGCLESCGPWCGQGGMQGGGMRAGRALP